MPETPSPFPSFDSLSESERAAIIKAAGSEDVARAGFERFRARKLNYGDKFPDRAAFVTAAAVEFERVAKRQEEDVVEIPGWHQFLSARAKSMGRSEAEIPEKWSDLSPSLREIVHGQRAIVANYQPKGR